MTYYDSGILCEGYGIIPKAVFKDTRLSGNAKLIYSCLSSYSGGQSSSRKVWPSIKTLCEDCGLSDKTVVKHLRQLEELDYIKIIKQKKENGGYANNIYVLSADPYSNHSDRGTGAIPIGVPESFRHPTGVIPEGVPESLRSNNNNKTISYNNNNKTNTVSGADQETLDERFEKLWSLYPRKERKPDARKAYKRAIKKGVTDEEIKAGIESYIKQVKIERREYSKIAQGGTWFNQERWEDEYNAQSISDLGDYSRKGKYSGLW